MKELPVNIGDLETALEDHDGELGLHSYWFDTQTGEVIFLTDDLEEDDEVRERIEQGATERFVRIEPIDPHEAFRVMADFVATLPSNRFRVQLERCLSSKKPFRRFKDALHDNKQVQDRWYKFNNEAVERYALEWLANLGIEPLGRAIGTAMMPSAERSVDQTNELEQEDEAGMVEPASENLPAKKILEGGQEEQCRVEGRASEAGLEFVARKLKLHHPEGTFDEGGRFYPSEHERRDCCTNIRAPSRAFPYSLMVHCCTVKHVTQLYQVSEKDLRAEAEKVQKQLWYLCFVRDFDRVRSLLEASRLSVDPFLPSPTGQLPRMILSELRPHGIMKRQVWDRLFAALDDYEKRWRTSQVVGKNA